MPSSPPPKLTQTASIFENDDGTGVDNDTQQAAGNAAITNVRAGERVTVRTQITNNGGALGSSVPLSLFYDRGDNYWSKVTAPATPVTGTGTCTNTAFDCATVDATGNVGSSSSTAVDSSGTPWVSYYDATSGDLKVAKKVNTGGNCASGIWQCTTVESSGTTGQYSAMAIDASGAPWISYYNAGTAKDLRVAHYVGTGGTGCATTAWTCVNVDTSGDVGQFSAIALDTAGNPRVSYLNATSADLKVASYVGTGGSGCATTAWSCVTVQSTGAFGQHTSIAVDAANVVWVSFVEQTNGDLYVAHTVASGGTCNASTWSCDILETANSVGWFNAIALAPDGTPWVSYAQDSAGELKVAHRVAGTGCDDSAWTCETVKSAGDWVGDTTSIAFDPGGHAEIAYWDDTNRNLGLARQVGTGGTGCATAAWQCTAIDSSVAVTGVHPSLAFGPTGTAFISYQDTTNNDLRFATLHRGGEITIAPGTAGTNGAAMTESHADMATVTDATNRDDADCATAGSWNNGKWFTTESPTGFSLPTGNTTPQCSEVAFTIDTSNAQPNTTYRFVVATGDGWRADKGLWRGPIVMTNSPTLTVAATTTQRVSKQALTTLPATTADLGTHLDAGSTPRTASTPCTQGYCAIAAFDASTDTITAASGQTPIVHMVNQPVSTSVPPSVTWAGQSTVAPSANAITVQVYRFGTTNAWQTITPSTNTCTAAAANTSCTINGTASGPASDYYQSGTAYYRISQAAGAETLKTDLFAPSIVAISSVPLQFKLTWNNDADMDLYVTDPTGTVTYYGNPGPSATGATFNGDDNVCGNPGATGGTESTSWSTTPPTGTYIVGVDQYDTCGGTNASWTLQVIVNGTVVQTQTGTGDGPDNITYVGA